MAPKTWSGWGCRLAIVALLFAAMASGQDINGGIRGTVVDSTGAVVMGAKVTAKNSGTGYSREISTDNEGGYIFTLLPAGTYEVSVVAPGFQQYVRTGIILAVNQVAGVNVALQLGSTTQQVDVKESAVTVNTQTSEVGMLTEGQQIRELPLNGRNPIQLASLQNGVLAISIPVYLTGDTLGNNGSHLIVNGNRYHQTQFNLDGGEFATLGYGAGLNYPNPDALQEFRLMTSNYSADFGRLAGGVMNVITKSGTNQIHGSAWEFNRNSVFGAAGKGNTTKPFLNQNQFGFTLGGPVLKDKLFLFGTAQWLRIASNVVVSGQYLPTAPEKLGDFSGSVGGTPIAPVVDPLTGQPFPGNIIPTDRLDPIAVALINLVPLPNMPDGTYYKQGPQPVFNHQYLVKSDYQVNSSNRLSVSVFRDLTALQEPFGRHGGGGNGFPAVNSTGGTFRTNGTNVSSIIVGDTHVFRPNLINQVRFGYVGLRFHYGMDKPPHPNLHDINPAYPDFGAVDQPEYDINDRAFAGRGWWGNIESDDYQFMDKVSYIHGAHSIKLGVEFRNAGLQTGVEQNAHGVFWAGFPGTETGNPLADYMLGIAWTQIDSPATTRFAQKSWIGYAQDDFKINPRFVLNFGIRYQLAPFWTPTVKYKLSDGTITTGLATWNLGEQSTLFPNAPPGLVYANDPGIPANGSYTDKTNWIPRAGFAWDLFGNGKTSLRGGFGLFDEMPAQHGNYSNRVEAPFGVNEKIGQTSGYAGPGTGFVSWPGANYYPAPAFDRNMSFASVYPYSNQMFSGLHPRNAMVYQYNLTLERQLTNGVVLSAAYVGNQGRRLPWNQAQNPAVYIPGNDANGLPLSTEGNTASRRVLNRALPSGSPNIYGDVGVIQYTAISAYDSLQVQMRSRDYHGLTLQGNYTWSHARDNENPFAIQEASGGVQDSNCLQCEYGNSDFDRRHMLVLSYTYHTPSLTKVLGWNNSVLRKLLDDYGFSGISSFSTGPYVSITSANSDNSLTANGHDRANVVGDWRLPGGRSDADRAAEFFNTTAFTQNSVGEFGNSHRNFLPTPGMWTTDFAILKHVPLWSDHRELELRAEAFNAFNHPNFLGPNTVVGAPGFGKANQGSQVGRLVQFGAKILF